MTQVRVLLMGLCEQEDCICGTPFDSNMKEYIKTQTDTLLDEEKMVAVSEMQSAFKSAPVADRTPLSAAKARVADLSSQLSEQQNLWETEFSEKSTEKARKRRSELEIESSKVSVKSPVDMTPWSHAKTVSWVIIGITVIIYIFLTGISG